MEVSGRKASDFLGSETKDSSEEFEHSCEPCLAIDHHVEAHGFCLNCNEYLCKNCFAYHQRIKATKEHHLLGKACIEKHTMLHKDLVFYNENCLIHKNELIKFFCTNHEFLGCNDCMRLYHRACEIDYIPDKCAGFGDSDEYRNTLRELDQKMKDVAVVVTKATAQCEKIDSSYDIIIKEILKFRKDINARLDQLQSKVQSEAVRRKRKDKRKVKEVLETCTNVFLDTKKLKSILQESKTSLQSERLYMMIKHAQTQLKLDDDLKHAQESLEQTNSPCKFERNTKLRDFIRSRDALGKLSLSTTLVTQRMMKVFDKLFQRRDIIVRTEFDTNDCLITGCAVLSSDKCVIADYNNCKLKVVDTQNKSVVGEMTLDSMPFDIAALPQNQICVTMLDKKEILVLSTAGELYVIRSIPVEGDCRGIRYHQDRLYVVCSDSRRLLILDTQGKIDKNISLKNEQIQSPNYILLSDDSRQVYISSSDNQCVVSVTLQGDILAVYKPKYLKGPLGMMGQEDGSLLVCCYYNHTIRRISGDLKQGQTILDGLQYPRFICYNQHQQEVYIGGYCDTLTIAK